MGRKLYHRRSDGKFRKGYLTDYSSNVACDYRVCECGYGGEEPWIPVLETGICPECESQNKSPLEIGDSHEIIELKKELKSLRSPFINPQSLGKLTRINSKIELLTKQLIKQHFKK